MIADGALTDFFPFFSSSFFTFTCLKKYILFQIYTSSFSQLMDPPAIKVQKHTLKIRCFFSYLSYMHVRDKTTKLMCECLCYNLNDCWWPTTFLYSIFFLLYFSLLHTCLIFFFFLLFQLFSNFYLSYMHMGDKTIGTDQGGGPLVQFFFFYLSYTISFL